MKIFMSNYILQCRICSKLPENRVSWEKNRVSREKIEFWAFGQNRVSLETHKKKACNNADFSEATKYLASVQMRADKLHIKNHVGTWCSENCDPRKGSAKKALKKVNSVVCEQKFAHK